MHEKLKLLMMKLIVECEVETIKLCSFKLRSERRMTAKLHSLRSELPAITLLLFSCIMLIKHHSPHFSVSSTVVSVDLAR